MASFLEWRGLHFGLPTPKERAKAEAEERKPKGRPQKTYRFYYAYGRDRVAVEELVDEVRKRITAPDINRMSLTAGAVPDAEIWGALNQYPLDKSEPRLVIVRDAEKIQNWNPLEGWLEAWREMRGSHALFISNETNIDTSLPHFEVMKKPSSSILVNCTLNGEAALAYLQTKNSALDRNTAMYLLSKTGDKIQPAVDCLRKAAFLKTPVSNAIIDALVIPQPATEFEQALIENRKPAALATIAVVPESDYSRIIGALNARLDSLAKINRALKMHRSTPDVIKATRLDANVVRLNRGTAPYYDRAKVASCLRVLAAVDAPLQRGERKGILEALVALW